MTLFLVAKVEGRVIASSDISLQKEYEKHVGVVGIVVKGGSGTWASERLYCESCLNMRKEWG